MIPVDSPAAVNELRAREILVGVVLASTSGLAILVHVFLAIPMSFTVPVMVLPSSALLVGVVLFRRRSYGRLHRFADLLLKGGVAGFLATLAYDAIRPTLVWIFALEFDPYRAIPIFGQLITGRSPGDALATVCGWAYHFWNGISFGSMFALVVPSGGKLRGFVWAMGLQGLMMWTYPSFLQIRLANPGFLATGIIGHGLWGVVLGELLERWGRKA